MDAAGFASCASAENDTASVKISSKQTATASRTLETASLPAKIKLDPPIKTTDYRLSDAAFAGLAGCFGFTAGTPPNAASRALANVMCQG